MLPKTNYVHVIQAYGAVSTALACCVHTKQSIECGAEAATVADVSPPVLLSRLDHNYNNGKLNINDMFEKNCARS